MSANDGIYISRRTIRIIQAVLALGLLAVLAAEAPGLYRYAKLEAM